MKKHTFVAATLVALFFSITGSVSAQTAPVKGTVCFAQTLRDTEHVAIFCKGLGKFASIAEIYERGFRVVSSGIVAEAGIGTGTVFLIIEERK